MNNEQQRAANLHNEFAASVIVSPPDAESATPLLSSSTTSQDSLVQMTANQQPLSEMKQYLNSIMDTLQNNLSFLSRASNFWGKLPIWLKIIGGIVFFGTLITIGILANLMVLIIASIVFAAEFVAGSYLLDDHYSVGEDSRTKLKEGIFSLANLLELTINALDKIREQLAVEVDDFKQENQKFRQENAMFGENISKFHAEIEVLNLQINQLTQSNTALSATQEKLTLLTKNYEELNGTLFEKVAKFAGIKSSMSLEIENLKRVGGVLQSTVLTLSETVLADDDQRSLFRAKLEAFLSNSLASFDQVAERICKAERELAIAQIALDLSNKRYEGLIDRHTEQVDKLEKMSSLAQIKPGDTSALPIMSGTQLFMFHHQKTVREHAIGLISAIDDNRLIPYTAKM